MDYYIWNNSDTIKELVLSDDTGSSANPNLDGFPANTLPYFQVWRTGTNIVESLFVKSFQKKDAEGANLTSTQIVKIDGGSQNAEYHDVVFAKFDKVFNITKTVSSLMKS